MKIASDTKNTYFPNRLVDEAMRHMSARAFGFYTTMLFHGDYDDKVTCTIAQLCRWAGFKSRGGAKPAIAELLGFNMVKVVGKNNTQVTYKFVDQKDWVLPADTNKKPFFKKKKISHGLRMKVFERDFYRCVTCKTHLNLTCDHVIPESKGGPTTFENLQTMCKSCNSRKGDRT